MTSTHHYCFLGVVLCSGSAHDTTLPTIDDTTQFAFLGFCVVFLVCVSGGSSTAPYIGGPQLKQTRKPS